MEARSVIEWCWSSEASQGVIAAAASVVRHGTKIATMTSNYGGVVLGLRSLARRADATLRELPALPPT